MEKRILILIKSAPITNLNYYEALRTAAGLWDHEVKTLWTEDGVLGAVKTVDQSYTQKFLKDLPDLDIPLYVDISALKERGFDEEDLIDDAVPLEEADIVKLLEETEVSLVF